MHRCPLKVHYRCVADGWQAATGVSAGKLSLRVEESELVESDAEDRKTGRHLRFRLLPSFIAKYLNTPYPDQARSPARCSTSPTTRSSQSPRSNRHKWLNSSVAAWR